MIYSLISTLWSLCSSSLLFTSNPSPAVYLISSLLLVGTFDILVSCMSQSLVLVPLYFLSLSWWFYLSFPRPSLGLLFFMNALPVFFLIWVQVCMLTITLSRYDRLLYLSLRVTFKRLPFSSLPYSPILLVQIVSWVDNFLDYYS